MLSDLKALRFVLRMLSSLVFEMTYHNFHQQKPQAVAGSFDLSY
jgi:hypothetical protein|tara:strand:- start:1152 stop:1283 length:132 start_codon:yes stop_codon:yes gene_type:complete